MTNLEKRHSLSSPTLKGSKRIFGRTPWLAFAAQTVSTTPPLRILGISTNVPCHTNRKLTRRPALPAKHTRTRLIRTSTHIMLELAPAVVLSASSQAQQHAVHYEDCPSRVTSWAAAELTVAARASRLIDSSVIARQASP